MIWCLIAIVLLLVVLNIQMLALQGVIGELHIPLAALKESADQTNSLLRDTNDHLLSIEAAMPVEDNSGPDSDLDSPAFP